jgi:hypothetical protein
MLPAGLAVAARPALAAGSGTTLTLTLTRADGITPMAGAHVAVFYMPFNPPDSGYDLPLMATSTADSTGYLSLALDTSVIPAADLADLGMTGTSTVPDAFNVNVSAQDSLGNYAEETDVVRLGSDVTDTVSVNPDLTASSGVGGATDTLTMTGTTDTKYRYVKIGPETVGNGECDALRYTKTTSTAKQLEVQAAVANGSGTGGPWRVGGYFMEAANRGATRPWDKCSSYHYWVWVQYAFKLHQYHRCVPRDGCHNWHRWEPDHWTLNITDSNPDNNSDGKNIGKQAYDPPPFDPGPSNAYFVILSTSSDFVYRNGGTREGHSFGLSFAGFLTVNAKSTYGTITTMKWTYDTNSNHPGCSAPNKRVIWGEGTDVYKTKIVDASCMNP